MSWWELARTGLHHEAWTLFGRLPVALLCVGLLAAGRRRGWGWRPALLATAALGAGASVGTALLPGVVGAIAGGVLAWLAAQRALGLRRPPLVALAFGLTLLVASGRIGCHLAGCCFGTATDLPWAVHHDPGSAAFALHAALGHLAPDAARSLGVHPYPLYESLALLIWLPLLGVLARRLRSEGALLALTGAYDLAVRAGIDGTRAMVNVWWAKLTTFAGIDLLQGTFALAALGLVGTALLLERRTRRNPATHPAPDEAVPRTDDAAPRAGWAVFGAAWLAGVLGDGAQTPFLHQLHVLTLLAAAPALEAPQALQIRASALFRAVSRIPCRPRAWISRIRFSDSLESVVRTRTPALVALALAAIPLAAVLARALEPSSAHADGPRATLLRDERRDWLYEVDHRRALLVRLGALGEPLATLRARRRLLALGPEGDTATGGGPGGDALPPLPDAPANGTLPPAPDAPAGGSLPPIPDAPATTLSLARDEAPLDPLTAAERNAFRHWLGLALAGGATSYTRLDGCGGPSTLIDREGFAGWLRYEALRGLGESAWSLRFGGSAGAHLAATRKQIVGEPLATLVDERLGFVNGWVELEEPRLSVGLAVYGDLLSTATRIEGLPRVVEERLRGRIGGHLRAGFSQLGIEAGYLDRDALLGPTTFRLGFVGMLGEGGAAVRHLSEVRYRYGLGIATYPAVGAWLDDRFGFYALGEFRPTERVSLGLQAAYVENGAMVGATVMLRGD